MCKLKEKQSFSMGVVHQRTMGVVHHRAFVLKPRQGMANEMQRGAEVGRGMEGASNVCEVGESMHDPIYNTRLE